MRRRTFLKAGTAGIAGLAGCIGGDSGGSGTDGTTANTTARTELSGTLNVATYSSFVDAPSSSPGPWIKKQFEKKYPKATLKWQTPENEVSYFLQRKAQGVDVNADAYVGLNVDHLIRIDEKLGNRNLFVPVADALSNYGHVKDELTFDPKNRAIPYDTGYISLVYNGHEVDDPGTFGKLAKPKYANKLIAENAQQAATGRAFLLWTVHQKGPDGYLDYWKRLKRNGVKILGSWDAAYTAYSNGERPIVVSYSTDRVYANRQEGVDMKKHKVGFLNDEGYANPEGMAKFAGAKNPKLADAFLDFMLTKEVQAKIATLNVQFPATDWAKPGEEFRKYAKEPENPVTFSYDELKGNVEEWVEQWARQVAR
ncbi:thiamine ABC transporter substrate-binding protein [halophilic archaeon]|nr:thiamine ABC transporter substrate-binding protein [halophilic archaeon]